MASPTTFFNENLFTPPSAGGSALFGAPTAPTGGGSNQFFSTLPAIPSGTGGGSGALPSPATGGGGTPSNITPTMPPFGDWATVSPLSPQFSSAFFNWLQSKMGTGATPYGGSGVLPSGGVAGPGQLSAPLNDLLTQLMQFYEGGGSTNIPGLNVLQQIATSDTALPAFQAIKDAMQRAISEGRVNLKEQFNFSGGLASSPFGTAATDYETQTTKDLNALLAQMEQQALTPRMRAAEALSGGATNIGQFLQSLDQDAIARLYQEFLRTQPEYNPLLNMIYGLSTTFPPVFGGNVGIGAGGAALGSAGSILQGVVDLIGVMRGGGGGGSTVPTTTGGGGGGTWPGGGF